MATYQEFTAVKYEELWVFNLSKTDIAFDNPLYKELLEYIKVELNFRNCYGA